MDWIVQSGPIGLAVVGLGLVGLVWAALGTARPVRWWADVWVAFACGLTNLGVLGTTMGLVVAFSAVANAPTANKAAVLDQALGLATRPLSLAAASMATITAAAALAHALRRDAAHTPRPPTWGNRLLSTSGLVVASTLPALGLATTTMMWTFQAGSPSMISTLLYATAAGSLLSILALILYVPFRLAVGWQSARATTEAAA